MAARFLAFTILFLGRGHALDASPYADYFLPTPTIATPLNTTAGFDILLKPTTLRRSYVALAPHFATQSTQSYCAVASSVMALNALPAVAAPVDGAYAPYGVLDAGRARVDDEGRPRPHVRHVARPAHGGAGARARPPGDERERDGRVERLGRRAAAPRETRASRDAGVARARQLLPEGPRRSGRRPLVALAAYDADGDLALLLDVARYKYPPVWVPLADLAKALVAGDADNAGGAPRGVLVLEAT
ncbi:glutathione gamma-glutamylcysteinyltransferase [Aureococcus anophagefferens]|nr:glutathione gamma-glutamylcysteinyltransferase [Aureococcus anophagefferens]